MHRHEMGVVIYINCMPHLPPPGTRWGFCSGVNPMICPRGVGHLTIPSGLYVYAFHMYWMPEMLIMQCIFSGNWNVKMEIWQQRLPLYWGI